MLPLRFRQVHLDFHTSEKIPGIGAAWDKEHWQRILKAGHVDSITCFSNCHHGWSYHPTSVGKMHPHLDFDLLRAQLDACHEIDVKVPIYLTGGVDNVAALEHPEWREIDADGRYMGWAKSPLQPGFHKLCFNSPYLDYLVAQIEEVVTHYPDGHGIFIDIIYPQPCACKWCMAIMDEEGLDPEKEADRMKCGNISMLKYLERTTAAARKHNADMPIFHNSSFARRGRRATYKYFSHLEVESLPTGGWGYDNFPLTAKYFHLLDKDFIGMTGKFHTTWGEFGGFKHPNALRYECAAMLANGARCSVGDQLHPNAKLDESTYALIGAAYAEVEAKEPWCVDAQSVADVALLSRVALNPDGEGDDDGDTGAARLLLEGHYLYDIVDDQMDWNRYKVLWLPDSLRLDGELKAKLDAYVEQGGKLFLSGETPVREDGSLWFDIGAHYDGPSPYQPDYIQPREDVAPDFVRTPQVMYLRSQRIKVTTGQSLGAVYDPYFNRSYQHFSSHQHTPYRPEPSGYDCGVLTRHLLYLAHPVSTLYRGIGAVALKDYVCKALDLLLGEEKTVRVNLPSTGRVTLMQQANQQRYILHLLHANTINRGGPMKLSGGTLVAETKSVELIEDLIPLHNIDVQIRLPHDIRKVTLEPQGSEVEFTTQEKVLSLRVDEFTCHQMIVFHP
jgi:hypothetical protein